MYVAHFEARALAGQATRAQRRYTALVGDFRQRVVLIHKLRELTGAKELVHRSRYGLRVNQVLRHQAFAFRHGEPLFHRALHAHQADAELVFRHLAHGADATVTEVVNIIDHALAVTDIDQCTHYIDDVFFIERGRASLVLTAEATIELHTPYGRQVVALWGEEQVLEQVLCRLLGRGLARAHHAVDLYQRFEHAASAVRGQRVRNKRTAVVFIGVDGLDRLDALLSELGKQRNRDFGVALSQHLAGRGVDNIFRQTTLFEVFLGNRKRLNTGIIQLADMTRGDATATLYDELLAGHDVEGRHIALQTLGYQRHRGLTLFAQLEGRGIEKHVENFFRVVTQRAQQHGRRQLAATVYSHI